MNETITQFLCKNCVIVSTTNKDTNMAWITPEWNETAIFGTRGGYLASSRQSVLRESSMSHRSLGLSRCFFIVKLSTIPVSLLL